MRNVLIGGVLLCSTLATLGPPARAAGAGDADTVIDPTRVAARVERDRAWYRATTVGAYDRIGLHDPRWDADARAAIEAFARMQDGPAATGDEPLVMFDRTIPAFHAGCRDPQVMYVRARATALIGLRAAEVARLHAEAAALLKASGYHAARKAFALARAAQYTAAAGGDDPAQRRAATALADDAVAALADAMADRDLPVGEAADLTDVFGQVSEVVYGDPAVLGERALAAAAKAGAAEAVVLTMAGEHHLKAAWDARGSGAADTVTPEGWRGFKAHLDAARAASERARALDPLDHVAARNMITVEMGDSHGRAEMEKWYARAVRARPDDPGAPLAKIEWLAPKWHGSAADVVAFGRELRDAGDWAALLPMLLVDAHFEAARAHPAPGPEVSGQMVAYFRANPDAWRDVKAVTDEYLRRAGDRPSKYHLTRYALAAGWAGQPAEMDAAIVRGSEFHAQRLGFAGSFDGFLRETVARATAARAAQKRAVGNAGPR